MGLLEDEKKRQNDRDINSFDATSFIFERRSREQQISELFVNGIKYGTWLRVWSSGGVAFDWDVVCTPFGVIVAVNNDVPSESFANAFRPVDDLPSVQFDDPDGMEEYMERLYSNDMGRRILPVMYKPIYGFIDVDTSLSGEDYLEKARRSIIRQLNRQNEAGVLLKPIVWDTSLNRQFVVCNLVSTFSVELDWLKDQDIGYMGLSPSLFVKEILGVTKFIFPRIRAFGRQTSPIPSYESIVEDWMETRWYYEFNNKVSGMLGNAMSATLPMYIIPLPRSVYDSLVELTMDAISESGMSFSEKSWSEMEDVYTGYIDNVGIFMKVGYSIDPIWTNHYYGNRDLPEGISQGDEFVGIDETFQEAMEDQVDRKIDNINTLLGR